MNPDRRRFAATLSPAMKVVTYAVGYGVGIGVPAILGIAFAVASSDWQPLLLPLAFVAILFIASRYRPLAFEVTDRTLEVDRPAGPLIVKLDDIRRVTSDPELLHGVTLGIARVGGFYGNYGRFWNRRLGIFDAYLTGRPRIVGIERASGRWLLISPDDVEAFLQELDRARLRRRQEASATGSLASGASSS